MGRPGQGAALTEILPHHQRDHDGDRHRDDEAQTFAGPAQRPPPEPAEAVRHEVDQAGVLQLSEVYVDGALWSARPHERLALLKGSVHHLPDDAGRDQRARLAADTLWGGLRSAQPHTIASKDESHPANDSAQGLSPRSSCLGRSAGIPAARSGAPGLKLPANDLGVALDRRKPRIGLTTLQPGDGWLSCAHAPSDLRLGQTSSFPGLNQGLDQGARSNGCRQDARVSRTSPAPLLDLLVEVVALVDEWRLDVLCVVHDVNSHRPGTPALPA